MPDTPGRTPHRRPPSAHRKSHSTTELSNMANPPEPLPTRKKMSKLPPMDVEHTLESLTAAVDSIRSLRSSSRRRLHGITQVQGALASACGGGGMSIPDILYLKCHEPILALLGRHTASLAKRASTNSLAPGDDLANHLVPEVVASVMLLQGLCLVSKSCKEAVGQKWTLEMFLDLILLLRAQVPPVGQKAPVFLLIDLLFCIIVDAPHNARMFEELEGLEAVTRVLRGSGVDKDTKMKCCEFLYFYLQPEGSAAAAVSQVLEPRSVSASSSSDSGFHSPEPQSYISPQDVSLQQALGGALSRARSEAPLSREYSDPGLPFIPQTPRKPPKPTLGFQTPSAHRRDMLYSNMSGSSLPPVPPSPRSSSEDDGSLTKRDSAAWLEAQRKMDARGEGGRTASSSSMASTASTGSSTSSSTVVPATGTRSHRPLIVGSAVGSPATLSRTGSLPSSSRVSQTRPPSAVVSHTSSSGATSASSSASAYGSGSGSGSGSSARPPRGSTLLAIENDPALLARRGNKHVSKSPLAQSITPDNMRPPSSSSRRNSRAASATPSVGTPGPQRSSSCTPGVQRSRGFPSELTKGALPSATPSPVPLTPSRRVPSGPAIERAGSGAGPEGVKGMRTVAEKKELLGKWLGNVDEMVDVVEKGGFLGSRT